MRAALFFDLRRALGNLILAFVDDLAHGPVLVLGAGTHQSLTPRVLLGSERTLGLPSGLSGTRDLLLNFVVEVPQVTARAYYSATVRCG